MATKVDVRFKREAAAIVDRMVQATLALAEETGSQNHPTAEYAARYKDVVAPYQAELEAMGCSFREASGWRIQYLLGTPQWLKS